MRASGMGLTATHLAPFMSCRPPTWSWESTVRKSLSVPKASGDTGHGGYRFSLRKHVVSSHPSGKKQHPSPAPAGGRRASAITRASVPASLDMAPATFRVTSF
nr:unnamed protein product [Digitaria exilis]